MKIHIDTEREEIVIEGFDGPCQISAFLFDQLSPIPFSSIMKCFTLINSIIKNNRGRF